MIWRASWGYFHFRKPQCYIIVGYVCDQHVSGCCACASVCDPFRVSKCIVPSWTWATTLTREKAKKKHNFGSLKHELQLRVFWLDHLNSGLAFYVVYGCSNDWCAPRCCRFVSAQGVAIILNLDEKSPHANTVSWLLQEQGKVSVARIEKVPPVSSNMAWWKMDHRNQWFS